MDQTKSDVAETFLGKFSQLSWKTILFSLVAVFIVELSPLGKNIIPHFVAFHTILEFACITVCLMIFVVQFALRSHNFAGHFQILGIPFLGIGLIDLFHTLSYSGLPDFITPNSPQKSISFWLAARTLEVFSFLIFAILIKFKIHSKPKMSLVYTTLFGFLIFIFTSIIFFPETVPIFANDSGKITSLKVILEFLFIFFHLVIIWLLFTSDDFESTSTADLVTASCILAISGLTFSSFVDGHDMIIFLGHILKVLAYYFVFRSCLLKEILSPFLNLLQLSNEMKTQNQNIKNLQFQLQQAQRMSMLGQSTTSIVHDLNNMLYVSEISAKNLVHLLGGKAPQEEIQRFSESLLNSLKKTKDFQRVILQKARSQPQENLTELNLNGSMIQLTPLLKTLAGNNITIDVKVGSDLKIFLDQFQFEQILMNLIVNAKDAIGSDKKGKINIEISDVGENSEIEKTIGQPVHQNYIKMSITDDGPGIPPEILPKIFEPYFTTKPSDQGTGLGLATIKNIVDTWGGFIKAYSTPANGTQFVIFIPKKISQPSLLH